MAPRPPKVPAVAAANLRAAIVQAKQQPAPKYVPGNDYNIPVHNSGAGRPNFPGGK